MHTDSSIEPGWRMSTIPPSASGDFDATFAYLKQQRDLSVQIDALAADSVRHGRQPLLSKASHK
jgi:hypothetical protein